MTGGYDGHSTEGSESLTGGGERILPGLQGEERLPWLHSVDDELDDAGVDPGRVWAFVLTGLALLMLIVGGVWWITHRRAGGAQLADGSLIVAPRGPIKVAPKDPGGKLFDGTGDFSFAVSQGQIPDATLATAGDQAGGTAGAGAPRLDTGGADAAVASAGVTAGSVAVQLGAFSTQPAAESAWTRLTKAYAVLSGTSHRVVEGSADIGMVYRLQAMAGSDVAANGLCEQLKAAGLDCEVMD